MPPIALFAVVDAPWGPLHVAAARRGIVALTVLGPTEPFVERLERRLRGPVAPRGAARRDPRAAMLDLAVAEVREFLDGRRRAFDLPIDLADRPGWDLAILGAVRDVPWGAVTSYGRLARRVGRPGAARATGGAVGRNPIGLLVPCHRVIAGDGSLGGYGGDWYGTREQLLEVKRELLAREGVSLPARFSLPTRFESGPEPAAQREPVARVAPDSTPRAGTGDVAPRVGGSG